MKKILLAVVFVLAVAAGVWYALQDDKTEVSVDKAQSEEVVADSLTISEKKAIAETVVDSAVAVTDSIVTAE